MAHARFGGGKKRDGMRPMGGGGGGGGKAKHAAKDLSGLVKDGLGFTASGFQKEKVKSTGLA